MTVICEITIVVGLFMGNAAVEGKVTHEGFSKYIVNFSEGIKKDYPEARGDYSKRIVDKNKCVKL